VSKNLDHLADFRCKYCGGIKEEENHSQCWSCTKKGLSAVGVTFGFFVAMMFVIGIIERQDQPPEPPPKPLTAEQQLARRAERQFSGFTGEHRQLAREVKSLMRDPGSYEHIKTTWRLNEASKRVWVTTQFRGNNAFGGKLICTASGIYTVDGDVVRAARIDSQL